MSPKFRTVVQVKKRYKLKVKVALEARKETSTKGELAKKYEISPEMISSRNHAQNIYPSLLEIIFYGKGISRYKRFKTCLSRFSMSVQRLTRITENHYIYLKLSGLSGKSKEVSIKVNADKAFNHLDRVRITLYRLAGLPVKGRGYGLSSNKDSLDFDYTI